MQYCARVLLPLFLLVASIADPFLNSSAFATSRSHGDSKARAKLANEQTVCPISGRFVEAVARRGKVVWVFDRLSPAREECAISSPRFEVWIWEGRFSTLTKSFVYPTYLHEPKSGTSVDLRLERRAITELPQRERFEGWFLAAGDSFKENAR